MGFLDSIGNVISSTTSAVGNFVVSVANDLSSAAKQVWQEMGQMWDFYKPYLKQIKQYFDQLDENHKKALRDDSTLWQWQKDAARKRALETGTSYEDQVALINFTDGIAGSATLSTKAKYASNLIKQEGGVWIIRTAEQAAEGVAEKAGRPIKNVAGYVSSIAKKAATSAPVKQAAESTLNKVLKIGGISLLGASVVSNITDFYNWQGPIQSWLKMTFPSLFPKNYSGGKVSSTPKVQKMTTYEVQQMQSIIYEKTGLLLVGEELRQAIQKQFNITVIEEKPTKGNAPGPLSADDIIPFQNSVKSSTNKLTIKAIPQYMISNDDQLQAAALNEIAGFIQKLPALFTFSINYKNSFKDADGKTRKGNFAILDIYINNKKGTNTLVSELPLGSLPDDLRNVRNISVTGVQNALLDAMQNSVKTALPTLPFESPPTATANLATTDTIGQAVNGQAVKIDGKWYLRIGQAQKQEITDIKVLYELDPAQYQTAYNSWLKAQQQNQTQVYQGQTYSPAGNSGQVYQTPTSQSSSGSGNVAINAIYSLFTDRAAYKMANDATIYIYWVNQLHGVTSPKAFAKFYGMVYQQGTDLTRYAPIYPMPDLSKINVPSGFFNGSIITE